MARRKQRPSPIVRSGKNAEYVGRQWRVLEDDKYGNTAGEIVFILSSNAENDLVYHCERVGYSAISVSNLTAVE